MIVAYLPQPDIFLDAVGTAGQDVDVVLDRVECHVMGRQTLSG